MYRIPCNSSRIVKYDPINDNTSIRFVERLLIKFALGRDGCIYAISGEGQILKIDTTNNFHCFVGNSVKSDHEQFFRGRGDATLGIDGFIYQYSPPAYARRILKYDPHANKLRWWER